MFAHTYLVDCPGAGGLDADVVARAILRAVNTTTSSSNLQSLSNIRIILFKINIFLAFKKEVGQIFPHAIINTGNKMSTSAYSSCLGLSEMVSYYWPFLSFSVSASQAAHSSPHPPPGPDLSILCSSSAAQQSTFQIVGLCRKNVDDAMAKLKGLYQAQCSTQTFREKDLALFTQEDVNSLKKAVELLGLHVEKDQSGQGSWTVSGLNEGVDQMMQMIQKLGLKKIVG